jgi:hypothetical protein
MTSGSDGIVADTKDWTWVLIRECPECGFDTRTVGRDEVGPMLRANAAAWVAILAGTTWRPDRDPTCGRRWSTPATCATSSASSTSGWH